MELSVAGIIAAIGVLFGLIFVGLFVATYVFDRTATHVLYYLGATAAFLANGITYLLSIVTPYPVTFIVLVEMFHALGIILLAQGFDRAFSLGISKRFLWGLFGLGTVAAIVVAGRGDTDTLRHLVLFAWNATAVAYVIHALFRVPGSSFKHRFIAVLISGTAVASANRVITATAIQALFPDMSAAEQTETYGAIVNTVYMMSLFGIGAGLVFHVMSDLASDYRRASVTDALTGLLNRRGFIDAARDVAGRPAALIMLDIDHFKSINDTWGHDAGDRVIAEVAAIMLRAAPEPHICGRLGGEEFAILLKRTEVETAHALAQALRTAIALELDGFVALNHTVTASFGVAQLGESGISSALIAADHALYAAKRSGRNAVRLEGGRRRMGGRAARRAAERRTAMRA